MRLITRADFDGLVCAVLLNTVGLIDEYKFVHPKDVQDGRVDVGPNDVLANVPYAQGCGMWFDHHSSERDRVGLPEFKGRSKLGPSCARVIWEYYGGWDRFSDSMDSMLEAVDKVDSGSLSDEDIENPEGWVLIGFLMDPRTGLNLYQNYSISNNQLVLDMIDYCSRLSAEEILAIPDVKERTDRYFAQQKEFVAMIERTAVLHDNVLVMDWRNEEQRYAGNRFSPYAMYPQANVSIHVLWGSNKDVVMFTVGHSILNRTCTTDIGALMLLYGGGGHRRVGTCQIPLDNAEAVLGEIIEALKGA